MFIRIDDAIHKDIKESNYQFEAQSEFRYFGSTAAVNIFVGANNSGKSRFLRGLIKSKNIKLVNRNDFELIVADIKSICSEILHDFPLKNLHGAFTYHATNPNRQNKSFLNKNHEWLAQLTSGQMVSLGEDYFSSLPDMILKEWNSVGNNFNHLIQRKISEISLAIEIKSESNQVQRQKAIETATLQISNNVTIPEAEFKEIIQVLERLNELKIQKSSPAQKLYIPILRTASTLLDISTDTNTKKVTRNIFEDTVYKNYKFDKGVSENIIIYHTGLDLYQKIRKIRNSTKDIRNSFAAFEKFLSDNFFHGQEVDIVALDADQEEDQHISLYIDGKDRKIHELGDGIQAIIMLMYPIFTARDESWIFIEEPEINLHPGLQRIFLEQLLHNQDITKKNLKFFFTTHSNHLLDLSLELDKGVSIFTFEKQFSDSPDAIFKIKNVKNQDTDILRLLGVNNSSVFMANCSIWVEGICDRLYIRAYLRAYIEACREDDFKEDIHYAFFEYAGSNVSHYIFAKESELEEFSEEDTQKIKGQFLSNKIFLLADKDNGKEKKHTSFFAQENKNFQYECLEVREIENLLSPTQLIKFLPKINRQIKPDLLARKSIEQDSYKDEYLGKYLKKKLGKDVIKDSFVATSGTLATYYKNRLAQVASNDMKWEEMSHPAQELTKRIYEFIKKSNLMN